MSVYRDYEGEEVYEDHSEAEDGLRVGDFDDYERLDYSEDLNFNDAASVGSVVDDVEVVGAGGGFSPAQSIRPDVASGTVSDARSDELDITPFLCPDHGMNLDEGCERCERSKRLSTLRFWNPFM